MATTDRLSKGIFVFRGKKTVANAEDYFPGSEDAACRQEQFALCEQLLEKTNMYMQILQTDLNTKLFDDLVTFLSTGQEGFVPGEGRSSKSHVVTEVPTAALVTGVNMPDHGSMFATLATSITERVTPYVATVRSKDCLNLHAMLTKVVSQLMDNADLLNDDDEEEEEVTSGKKVPGNFEVLAAWYQHVTQKVRSAKRRKSIEGGSYTRYPPVVVILEDLEGFPAHALQDFVTICSDHLQTVPLVLVLGVATTVTAVHRLLPHTASSCLSIECFQAPPASEFLTQVLNELLISPSMTFKLGPKVFNLLLDLFLYHDFSVVNFVRGLQFSMMSHFLSYPWSVLCQDTAHDALPHLKRMDQQDLDQIRSLRSFRSYVEKCPPQEQINLLEDDSFTKRQILQLLQELIDYQATYFPVLNCLHTLVRNLPKHPLGKQLRELYSMNLSMDIGDLPEYVQAMGLLRLLSRDELTLQLDELTTQLDNNDFPPELLEVRTKLLEKLLGLATMEEGSSMEVEQTAPAPVTPLPKKMDMYTLKQKLKEMEGGSRQMTVYEGLRADCLDYLDTVFRRYLRSPLQLPLHEVFYYDDVSTVRQAINGSPRLTIQHALAKPYTYLQAESCRCDTNIPPGLPDICIAYKLHLECGRLINLYDWLQAFVMVVRAGDEEDRGDRQSERTLQARFIRAVSELQFLGFVKPTKRKTDHVARLTWGGC